MSFGFYKRPHYWTVGRPTITFLYQFAP